jgi:hypothetical protein
VNQKPCKEDLEKKATKLLLLKSLSIGKSPRMKIPHRNSTTLWESCFQGEGKCNERIVLLARLVSRFSSKKISCKMDQERFVRVFMN